MNAMLEVKDLRVFYGKVEAVKGVSFTVGANEIVALVGSNGAGKTTTLRAISGLLPVGAGDIVFGGESIAGRKAHDIVGRGVRHVPEGRRLFPDLTVTDNLRMGAYLGGKDFDFDAALQRVFAYFPRLQERRKQVSGTLSGGEQQMLSIGRALIVKPKLLMLDEPSFGLAPKIIEEIARIIVEIRRSEAMSVLLVEQNVSMAFALAERAYVVENGAIVLSGASADVAGDPHVREAYLGLAPA